MPQATGRYRILQVVTDTDRRGAQVFACDLGRALADRGHDVKTVALAPGTKAPPIDLPTLGTTARGCKTLLALHAHMAGADVTIAHGSSTLLACAVASVGTQKPWVYRQISESRFWAPTLPKRLRVAAALRRASHVVALSHDAAATLSNYLGLPPIRISVIPNAVPATSFEPSRPSVASAGRARLGVPNGVFLALYVGALVPEKGVDIAIRAVAATPETQLLIVGDGPQRSELELLARSVADGRVYFVGGMNDVLPAYAAADCLMLPSRGGDSMPAVLIEAGLCGLPSITCPVGEITEVIVHNETGLVTPVDDVTTVIDGLTRLSKDPSEANRLGTSARKRCTSLFTIDAVAGQWLDVLQHSVQPHS